MHLFGATRFNIKCFIKPNRLKYIARRFGLLSETSQAQFAHTIVKSYLFALLRLCLGYAWVWQLLVYRLVRRCT